MSTADDTVKDSARREQGEPEAYAPARLDTGGSPLSRFKSRLVIAHPKAFLSLWRQRIILTVRYFFRIPIDDVREQELRSLAHHMKNLAQQNVQLLQLVNNLAGRLAYYEQGPLKESHEEYLNGLEVGVMVKQGLVVLPKGNGHPR